MTLSLLAGKRPNDLVHLSGINCSAPPPRDHRPMDPTSPDRDRALQALTSVLDPEIGENIVDLGLVEQLDVDAQRVVLRLVLTSPTCPLGGAIAEDARSALAQALPGRTVEVEETDAVPWTPARLSPAARQRLGWDDAAG